jgi:hypothetical protein
MKRFFIAETIFSPEKTLKAENSGFVKTCDELVIRCQIARLWFRREW